VSVRCETRSDPISVEKWARSDTAAFHSWAEETAAESGDEACMGSAAGFMRAASQPYQDDGG
jgi:hypothetical protein